MHFINFVLIYSLWLLRLRQRAKIFFREEHPRRYTVTQKGAGLLGRFKDPMRPGPRIKLLGKVVTPRSSINEINKWTLTRVTRNSTIQLTNLRPSNSRSNWNLEMLVFEEMGKPEYPEKNLSTRPSNSRSNWNLEMLVFEEMGKPEYPEKNLSTRLTRTNNKLNPHMTPSPGIEPGPHWWRRVLSPLRHPLLLLSIRDRGSSSQKNGLLTLSLFVNLLSVP